MSRIEDITAMTPEEQIGIVRTIIAGGESHYADFSSAWHYGPGGGEERDAKDVARDIARTVVAFANSDGGELLVGVEDDGAVTGVPGGGGPAPRPGERPTRGGDGRRW